MFLQITDPGITQYSLSWLMYILAAYPPPPSLSILRVNISLSVRKQYFCLSGLTCRMIQGFIDLWHPIRTNASKHAQHEWSLMAEPWHLVWDEKGKLSPHGIKLVLFNLQSVFWGLLHSNCKCISQNSDIIRRNLLNSGLSLCRV